MARSTQDPSVPVVEPGTAGSRLTRHPWRALLLVLALYGACFSVIGVVLYRVFRLPQDLRKIEAFPTAVHFTLGGLLGYLLVPYLLRLPKGARSFRAYLHDTRLTRVTPFVPLLLLTLPATLSSSCARARVPSSTGSRKASRSRRTSSGRCST
jgi:H+/Cl- antiporter ClcA